MDARRTADRHVAMPEEDTVVEAEVSVHAADDHGWWGLGPCDIWEEAA